MHGPFAALTGSCSTIECLFNLLARGTAAMHDPFAALTGQLLEFPWLALQSRNMTAKMP